jgi:hypothetical protein
MPIILVAALTAIGLAWAVTSPAMAAPASHIVIDNAAYTRVVDQAQWWWRRHHYHHRHCWVGPYGRPHCGCGKYLVAADGPSAERARLVIRPPPQERFPAAPRR